ncbi:MAG TPA: DNA polymerase Y family protein [Microbacteriaceae bacterium]|nr:DNA polymerase Y family protein [Microbacteriaceae bacterium]
MTRALVVWVPDWPIVAAATELALDARAPLALIHRGVVFACSAAARSAGVVRGLSQREAQYRCPTLTVARYDESTDARRFEPCVRALEAAVPGVHLVRPGLLAVRARGPVRYFGGELEAAQALRSSLLEHGLADVRVGLASGVFTAEQVARSTSVLEPVRVLPATETAAFLAPLPVGLVSPDERTATLLRRLGVHTLGQFAALPRDDIRRRFGAAGVWAAEQAAGNDPARVVPREVPPEFTVEFTSDTPLERSDEIAFSMREHADRFDAQLRAKRLVCTAVRVELDDEHGASHGRVWLHPRWFTAADLVDRVRWQLDGLFRLQQPGADPRLEVEEFQRAGIVRVRLIPERAESTAHHESGLWGGGPDQRVHHALSRVQSMLGPEGVGTFELAGGRTPADRQVFVPWGDAPPPQTRRDQPWPGALTGVPPASVLQQAEPVVLCDAQGAGIRIDARGTLSGEPAQLHLAPGEAPRAITAWAGPWPLHERWWDAAAAHACVRCQLVDASGEAWLVVGDEQGWRVEARYD